MKKYSTLLMLALISIIGLSIYYIGNAKANNVERVFQFETLEGDEKYIDDYLFEANYYEDNVYENFFVTTEDVTPVKGIDVYYDRSYPMLQLFEERRSFFRAKNYSGRHLYNDEQSIAYVYSHDEYHYDNPTKIMYKVDRLQKETGEREKVEFITDVAEVFEWQTIEWVSNKGNQLEALAIRTITHNMETVLKLTFDFDTKTVTEEVLIEPKNNFHVVFEHSTSYYNTLAGTVISHYNNDPSEGVLSEQLYYYNIEDGLVKIDAPHSEEFTQYSNTMTEDYLVSTKSTKNELLIKMYNLAKAQWEKEFTIETVLDDENAGQKVQLVNDRLFILYEVEKGHMIEVVDSTNGEKLYAGLLTIKDVDALHYLSLYNVHYLK